jgi:hypothetical protein
MLYYSKIGNIIISINRTIKQLYVNMKGDEIRGGILTIS